HRFEEELQRVAVAQRRAQRGEAAVDPRPDAAEALLAEAGVRGVDAGGSGGQREGPAAGAVGSGRGAVDGDLAVLRELVPQFGPEGVGVGCVALPLQQPGEPTGPRGVGALAALLAFSVLGRALVGVAERYDAG